MDPVGGLVLSVGLVLLSAVLHLVKSQTSSGQLDRNSAVGIRTRATQTSDSAWRAGHLAAGPWLLGTALTGYAVGLLGAVFSLALAATTSRQGAGPLMLAGTGYVAVIVLLLIATSKANAAARAVAS